MNCVIREELSNKYFSHPMHRHWVKVCKIPLEESLPTLVQAITCWHRFTKHLSQDSDVQEPLWEALRSLNLAIAA